MLETKEAALSLVERKELLRQQLALVNERCKKTSSILARKEMIRKRETEAKAEAKWRASLERRHIAHLARVRQQELCSHVGPASHMNRLNSAEDLAKRVMRRAKSASGNIRATRGQEAPESTTTTCRKHQRVPPSLFEMRYTRGELPCVIEHRGSRNGLTWTCQPLELDYDYYLPIFFDGIRCMREPYGFVARQGVYELIEEAKGHPDCILPSLDSITKSLRLALITKIPKVVRAALNALQNLVKSNYGIGEALVPYYRQLLKILGCYFSKGRNTGDVWTKQDDIGTVVHETLELLEKTGGTLAFQTIKLMVPAYQSCLQ